MESNDYKSLLGLWKKLSPIEQKKFIRENVDKSLFNTGLVYFGFSKGNKNKDNNIEKNVNNESIG